MSKKQKSGTDLYRKAIEKAFDALKDHSDDPYIERADRYIRLAREIREGYAEGYLEVDDVE